MKPSILHVANYYLDAGGISAGVENLVRGLAREGYRTHVHHVGGPTLRRPAKYAHLLPIARHFDLIQAHGCADFGFFPILAGAIAARVHHKPFLFQYNDWPTTGRFVRTNPMVKIAVATAAAITAPGQVTTDLFRSYGKPLVTIPSIMNPDMWPFKDRDTFHPAFICTRNYYAPQLAIDTFLILLHDYPNATLVMCGKDKIENHAPRVTALGHIPRKYLYPTLSQADIYLNTFADDSFGYSVHEAMAAGLAVVSVPSPALETQPGPDVITFSENASPASLADALRQVIDDQDLTRHKVEAGRQAVQKLTWEAIFPAWRKLYDQVMAR